MTFSARVLKKSKTLSGKEIATLEVRYARIIHAELLTHRDFSRNAASSRAIPIQKMISTVWNDPFQPVWWGKNQSGMQAKEELTGFQLAIVKALWYIGSRFECVLSWLLYKAGLHKQIANRRTECDGWITVIITATNWSNFFALRTHPDAQPEFQHIAKMMKEAYDATPAELLLPGEWHLPLVDDFDDLIADGYTIEQIVDICVGRCARVSYLTHDGKRDPKADITLAHRLVDAGHMSPTEHPAQAPELDNEDVRSGNFQGFVQHRKSMPYEADFSQRPKS